MSKIEVDTIAPQSGTTLTVGESGDTITVPSGATFDASNATTTLPATVVTTDGSQTLTNKTIDASQLSDATVTTAKLAYNSSPFRNIIINGDMSIAQRGTSATGITTSGFRTSDRFEVMIATIGTYTITQDTDVPSGQGFSKSLKIDCTTADASPVSSDELSIRTKFEGQNLQYLKKGTANAESLTLSFWVKCSKTGNIQVNLRDLDNARMISYTATISSANTWEKKTVTFAGDTTGSLDNDNAASFQLEWFLDSGSDYSSGTFSSSWTSFAAANRNVNGTLALADNTANNFWITGVQLEAGTTASDFEFLPVDVNLGRCQRYFQYAFNQNQSYVNASQHVGNGVTFMTQMRATPSATTDTAYASGNIPNALGFIHYISTVWGSGMYQGTSSSGNYFWYVRNKYDAEL